MQDTGVLMCTILRLSQMTPATDQKMQAEVPHTFSVSTVSTRPRFGTLSANIQGSTQSCNMLHLHTTV